MGTISGVIKHSKNMLSYNTRNDDFINSYIDAADKIKNSDFIYSELGTMSYIIKVSKVVNYFHGLAFRYDFMISRYDKLYKDNWCYSDSCRFATEEEIKLIKKKIKNFRNIK